MAGIHSSPNFSRISAAVSIIASNSLTYSKNSNRKAFPTFRSYALRREKAFAFRQFRAIHENCIISAAFTHKGVTSELRRRVELFLQGNKIFADMKAVGKRMIDFDRMR